MQSTSQEWEVDLPFSFPQQAGNPQGVVIFPPRHTRGRARGPRPVVYLKALGNWQPRVGTAIALPSPEIKWGVCPTLTLPTLILQPGAKVDWGHGSGMERGRLGEVRVPGTREQAAEALSQRGRGRQDHMWTVTPSLLCILIVQLNFTYETQIQKKNFKMVAIEIETKWGALLSVKL